MNYNLMNLKERLKNLNLKKSGLGKAQILFLSDLIKLYPSLFKVNLYRLWKTCGDELDFLLSSCLRIKSARIKLQYEGGYKKMVNLSSTPGLKETRSSWKDVKFQEIVSISEDKICDFGKSRDSYRSDSKKKVHLSVLVNHPDILEDRLEKFWEFLQKFIDLRKYSGFESNGSILKPLKNGFPFLTLSVTDVMISIAKNEDEEKSDSFSLLSLPKFKNEFMEKLRYESDNSYEYEENTFQDDDNEFETTGSSLIKLIIEKFDLFIKTLAILEKKKEKLAVKTEVFLEEIKAYNRPLKVLKKLQT